MSAADLLGLVHPSILQRSGAVLYSGRAAFAGRKRLYVLGLNPGGSPESNPHGTIASHMANWRAREEDEWSEYCDESWGGRPVGTNGMQPSVLHLLAGLGLDPRQTPASNVVFVRSAAERDLAAEKQRLLTACWRLHEAVIASLGVDTLLCFGQTAGAWAREKLGAHSLVDTFRETNGRGWRSTAHATSNGLVVVTATHPSRVDWRNPAADPTSLLRRVLDRPR